MRFKLSLMVDGKGVSKVKFIRLSECTPGGIPDSFELSGDLGPSLRALCWWSLRNDSISVLDSRLGLREREREREIM